MKRKDAWGLASLILVLVITTHLGYDVLASFYADQAKAARAWFYILRGVEGCVLYCVVWALTPWEPVVARLATSVACGWGALEEAQTAVCRLATGIDTLPRPGSYHGLCDIVTGWPVYMLTLLVVLTIFALQYTRKK